MFYSPVVLTSITLLIVAMAAFGVSEIRSGYRHLKSNSARALYAGLATLLVIFCAGGISLFWMLYGRLGGVVIVHLPK